MIARVARAMWRGLIGIALLSPWLTAAQAGQHESMRQPMSGEDIQSSLLFDEWRVALLDRLGQRFNMDILPNGRFQATNLTGGGSVVGKWRVDESADLLCLDWDAGVRVSDGCYEVLRTGPLNYELVDPPTHATVWWFAVFDEIH